MMAELKTYKSKRNFAKTAEPTGASKPKSSKKRGFNFVVQKHRARALHYDFRLEIGKVLKSWAVPKGPSRNPNIRRLAMMTEDHPLSYSKFSGTIPKGEYGAGSVEIWDSGFYRPLKNGKKSFGESEIRKGLLEFVLKGKKIKGNWVLFRLGKDPKTWILKKMK